MTEVKLLNYNGEMVVSSETIADIYHIKHYRIIELLTENDKLLKYLETQNIDSDLLFIKHTEPDGKIIFYVTYDGFKFLTIHCSIFNDAEMLFWRNRITEAFENSFDVIKREEDRKEYKEKMINEGNPLPEKLPAVIDTTDLANNDDLGVKVENTRIVVSSRDVAKHFGKRHDNVTRDIKKLIQDDDKFNILNFEDVIYTDNSNRSHHEYLMTKEGFTLLTLNYNGNKYLEMKKRYIEKFVQMENELTPKASPTAYEIPKTFSEALRLAANIQEEKEKLQLKICEDEPKVNFANAVLTSETDILVRELAKLITQNGHLIGEKRLYKRLRDDGYLISKSSDWNRPMQRYIEMGLFRVKEMTVEQQESLPKLKFVTKVTPKGQIYFIKKYCPKEIQVN